MPSTDSFEDADDAVVITAASRTLRRRLRPLAWVTLEEVALDAVTEGGRLVARTSARRVAKRLGVEPGTAANALRALRREGLVMLEREQGPAGRFGLSVYVLGSIPGLTVVRPFLVTPCPASPRPVTADPAPPCVERPGAFKPRVAEAHTEGLHAATVGTPRADRTEPFATSARARGPQCPGQTALDLGTASS